MRSNLKYFLIFLLVAFIGFVLWYFKSIIAYIIISAVLSLIGRPLIDLLGKVRIRNIKIPRPVSALITLLAIWMLIFAFFRIFIPLLAYEAKDLSNINVEKISESLDEPLQEIEVFFNKYDLGETDEQSLEDYISQKIVSILNYSTLTNAFGSIASLLGNIFIAFFSISFITFFFLKDSSLLYNGIMMFVPEKQEAQVSHILTSIKRLLMRYFIGILIQITLIMSLNVFGHTMVGVGFNHAMIIGLFAGLFNVIPYIGPILGTSVGLLIGLATHLNLEFYTELLPMLLYMLVVFLSVQALDNFIFQPVIFSNSVRAHPLEIFLVILAAGYMVGVVGMILAIPAYTVIRVIAKEFFHNYKLVKKLTDKI